MGSELTEDSPDKKVLTYSQIFREVFPEYLVMGMTADEYWNGDCELVIGYRKAYRTRMETAERIADRDAWIAGMYIQRALASVALFVNGFVPRGAHPQDYPDRPLMQKAQEEKKAEIKKQKEENQTKLAMAMMQAAVEKFNRNFLKRQEAEKARAGKS